MDERLKTIVEDVLEGNIAQQVASAGASKLVSDTDQSFNARTIGRQS